ncbi:hypothetical protein FRC12_008838 [Ceratobasidium sp. 428]|nr:hypothetical protein FRC12_008838 [Ceratobasidium sp. 428]
MTDLHLVGQSIIPQDAISELVSVLQPRLALLHSLNVTGAYTYRLVRELLKVYSSHDASRVLKCLTLSSIQISPEAHAVAWPTSSLSRLVELDLNNLSGAIWLLFSQLVALLSNCTTLHILRLESLSIHEDDPQNYPVISLPLLRIFEFVTYALSPSELRVLSLLSPGPYPLDVRLYLYNMIEPIHITNHIRPLLMRSNVTRLTVQNPYLGERDNRFETLLSSTPHLRALILHQANFRSLLVLKELIAPSDGSNQRLPQLQCLCLIYGDCGPKSRESLKRIVAARSLNSLIFLTCRFTTLNPDEATSYNGDAWDTTQPEAVPEDFRQQLSEHVKKWVVLPRPPNPSQRNVDLFIEEVVTLD